MTQALFSIVIGVLLLGLLLYWAFRRDTSAFRTGLSPAESAKALQEDLPPADLIERILDPRDLDFVCKESASETVRLFERERQALAIAWLRQTRRQVGNLMSYQVAAVRQNVNLRPALEIKLALHYASFLMAYELVLGLSHVRGLFQVRRFVGYVTGIAVQFRGVSDKLLREQLSTGTGVAPGSAVGGR